MIPFRTRLAALTDASRQVLEGQTEGKKLGILDLDAIVEGGEADWRALWA